nr:MULTISPECIES: social motility and stimulation tgl protein [Myxococcaceae]
MPTTREQVASLHQSINSPHVAIPGKAAGPAQAFIVGLRVAAGLRVFVYLYLGETADCAVYVSDAGAVPAARYADEEGEALAFVESLGFMMDDARFRTLPPAQQDELLRTLPAFLKDPSLVAPGKAPRSRAEEKRSAAAQLGRLLASF